MVLMLWRFGILFNIKMAFLVIGSEGKQVVGYIWIKTDRHTDRHIDRY